MNDTVDKFSLRSHFQLGTSVKRLEWDETSGHWMVHTAKGANSSSEIIPAKIVVSAVGSLSVPNDMDLEGLDKFKGRYWHSAKWDQTYDWRHKRVAIIGNGCSAAQMVPDMLADGVGQIIQFGRSAHWYMPRVGGEISPHIRWMFRNIPLALSLYRFYLFYRVDAESITLETSPRSRQINSRGEKIAIDHIQSSAPVALHHLLIPGEALGCKRRVNDGTDKGSYLAALGDPRVTLVPQRAMRLDPSAIVAQDGQSFPIDAVCFATGYKVSEHLAHITVIGRNGRSLRETWNGDKGSHAYKTISSSGFPNLGLLFGPNAFPSNNSCLFHTEVQIEYLERLLFRPLLKEKSCSRVDVKRAVEEKWYTQLRERLTTMVWATGCVNYQLNKWQNNTSNYPYSSVTYRRHLINTTFSAFLVEGKTAWWYVYRGWDLVAYWPGTCSVWLLCFFVDKLERLFPML